MAEGVDRVAKLQAEEQWYGPPTNQQTAVDGEKGPDQGVSSKIGIGK